MISFLHTADLHLGVRLTRFRPEIAKKIREARFQAIERIRARAKEEQVQFVLVAGDLFDDHAVDQDIARRAYDLLESFPVPVYIISGNHDPLLPGAVWDRPPWNSPPSNVRLLRERRWVEVLPGVDLLPCPVLRKTSLSDPTAWIAQMPRTSESIRIGMAHGSLKVRDNLPNDDHLIDRDAACRLGLDYLALGHWHARQCFAGSDQIERTAYCGVHEPMRFPKVSQSSTGWLPYSSTALDEFYDAGKGEVLHVSINRPGAVPVIRPIEVGHLLWDDRSYAIHNDEELGRLIDQIGTREGQERCLLAVRLSGTLDAQGMLRLHDLRDILDRYLYGELDESDVYLRPTDEEIREFAGDGVLRRVLEKLTQESQHPEPATRQVAERAIVLLYQIGRETMR